MRQRGKRRRRIVFHEMSNRKRTDSFLAVLDFVQRKRKNILKFTRQPKKKKRPLISDHIKGPLVAAFRSPLMKALDRSVETLGL